MYRLNIWLIQTGEPLPFKENIKKMRTALLADKLIERGHSVLWWTSAYNHLRKEWIFKKDTNSELKMGLTIIAIKGLGYKKNISLSRFIDHRIIARKFRKIAPKMQKPDIIITSMPSYDLAYESVMFAKRNNIPVLVDIRDLWPDIFFNHVPSGFKKLAKKLFYKEFLMIKKTMKMADGLLSIMVTFLEWGLKYAEREKTCKDQIFYLGGKRNLNSNNKSNKIMRLINNLNDKFIVTFIGTFGAYHNPSILVDCATQFLKNNIYFIIAGDGKFFNEIEKKASTINNVLLPGWLNQNQITTLLQHSNVGVCPTAQNVSLFPNKAFSYFSAGLPVISAFRGDLQDIIEKYQIGFYYSPNDVDALVGRIKRLYEDKELYQEMSENATRVFDEMFDADKIYEEYADHIENVVNEYGKQKRE